MEMPGREGKMKFNISEEIRTRCPEIMLGVLEYEAEVRESSEQFLDVFEKETDCLAREYHLPEIAKRSHIAATREAYKALGKAPQEYRNSAEAMLRRIVKGNGLYHINNIVDIGNLFSVKTGYSLGSYDAECVSGDVILKRAPEGTHYEGIGKSSINIGCLPVLCDEAGPFGNPTSDSQRAMLRDGMHRIFTVVYFFDKEEDPGKKMEELSELLQTYGGVSDIQCRLVNPAYGSDGGEGACLQ